MADDMEFSLHDRAIEPSQEQTVKDATNDSFKVRNHSIILKRQKAICKHSKTQCAKYLHHFHGGSSTNKESRARHGFPAL